MTRVSIRLRFGSPSFNAVRIPGLGDVLRVPQNRRLVLLDLQQVVPVCVEDGAGGLLLSVERVRADEGVGEILVADELLALRKLALADCPLLPPGATLALPIPAAGEAVPTVPSLVVEDGGNLAAIAPALPEGVMRVDVLRTTGELSIPEQNRDAAGNVFFAKTTAEGCVLQYGKPLGLQILVR